MLHLVTVLSCLFAGRPCLSPLSNSFLQVTDLTANSSLDVQLRCPLDFSSEVLFHQLLLLCHALQLLNCLSSPPLDCLQCVGSLLYREAPKLGPVQDVAAGGPARGEQSSPLDLLASHLSEQLNKESVFLEGLTADSIWSQRFESCPVNYYSQ